jgi:transcriptional regulator with XRE-family HTH domain
MAKATQEGHRLIRQLGKRVRFLRDAKGLTRDDLAAEANMSLQNVTKIENGERFVSAMSLLQLSDALNVSISDLFNFEESRSTRSPAKIKLEAILKNLPEKQLMLICDVAARILRDFR